MTYSERAFFDGYHFAHIAVWEDDQRLKRARTQVWETQNRRAGRILRAA